MPYFLVAKQGAIRYSLFLVLVVHACHDPGTIILTDTPTGHLHSEPPAQHDRGSSLLNCIPWFKKQIDPEETTESLDCLSIDTLCEHNSLLAEVLGKCDAQRRTPLHFAAQKDKLHFATLLLEKGEKIDAQDQQGQTPLHFAAQWNHVLIIRLLTQKGATIDAQDQQGRTPLHFAAQWGHVASIELLIEKGATIDAQDQQEKTPLWAAVATGQEKAVQALLAAGANPAKKDKNKISPKKIAQHFFYKHKNIKKLLKAKKETPASPYAETTV